MRSLIIVPRIALALAVLGSTAGPAIADGQEAMEGVQPLLPGVASTLPGKGVLPRREGVLVATVGAELVGGPSNIAVNGVALLRLGEALGLGAGLRGAAAPGPFLRMEVTGLSVNHWAVIGYADYALADGWWLGGALIAPFARDTYLRIIAGADEHGGQNVGLGVEYDLW